MQETGEERVDKITPYEGHTEPHCIYKGPKLTKKLKPYANGDRAVIWQNDLRFKVVKTK